MDLTGGDRLSMVPGGIIDFSTPGSDRGHGFAGKRLEMNIWVLPDDVIYVPD